MKTIDRLQELNNCLLNKSFLVNYAHFSAYIKDKFDVVHYAERSFNRDIKELKELLAVRFPHLEIEYGSLIKFSRSGQYFYFVRQDISAFPGFSEKELSQLAHSIEQNKHLFTDGLGKGILQKLHAIGLENRLSRFHQDVHWPVLQLIKDGERSGGQWLEMLLEKIYCQEVIEMEHKGLKKSSGVKKMKGLPLMIKEYNNGWYTGWYVLFYPITTDTTLIRPVLEKCWCFALDRIVGISATKENYQLRIGSDFNPADYFEDMMGIFRSHDTAFRLHTIVFEVRLDSWLYLYVQKYPLHKSQALKVIDQHVQVSLRMELTKDLENFMFQYLDEIQVVGPKELKEHLRMRLRKVDLD
ncbi:MAG: hypothetical protein RI995_1029 [Bacteroidota bacterium]